MTDIEMLKCSLEATIMAIDLFFEFDHKSSLESSILTDSARKEIIRARDLAQKTLTQIT